MILSDAGIAHAIKQGDLIIDPLPQIVQPASIDVHLSNEFRVYEYTCKAIDPRQPTERSTRLVTVRDGCFIIQPGQFVLGSTVEFVALSPKYVMRIEGKSSLGRLGLLVHATAGLVDPGFRGDLTLELCNVMCRPIQLWPGMKIAQLTLEALTSPARRPYGHPELGSKYQDQRGPTVSRAYQESADGEAITPG